MNIGKLIGTTMHNWFEIATNDDVRKLAETDPTLSQKINEIKNILETQAHNLINFEQQTNKFKKQIQSNFDPFQGFVHLTNDGHKIKNTQNSAHTHSHTLSIT